MITRVTNIISFFYAKRNTNLMVTQIAAVLSTEPLIFKNDAAEYLLPSRFNNLINCIPSQGNI